MAGKNVTCNGHLKYTQRYTASYCLTGTMLVTDKRVLTRPGSYYALGINSSSTPGNPWLRWSLLPCTESPLCPGGSGARFVCVPRVPCALGRTGIRQELVQLLVASSSARSPLFSKETHWTEEYLWKSPSWTLLWNSRICLYRQTQPQRCQALRQPRKTFWSPCTRVEPLCSKSEWMSDGSGNIRAGSQEESDPFVFM